MIQHKPSPNLKVGIIIPTMNRPEFIIRQLNYYASINCPHPIYIGDSSDDEHAQKLQKEIERKREFLKINYWRYPKSEFSPAKSMAECMQGLFSRVKEKYTAFIGDDDYQIPSSLSKCAEFLENNPDYSSASGQAVSFRLINNGSYGELKRLSDYPRRKIEFPTAAERLADFMPNYYVPLFSVHKTELMKKCWSQTTKLKNWDFSTEILPSAMSLIWGKSKILDCLGFVRQIHNIQHESPNIFDWITGKDWYSSYEIFSDTLANEIVAKDNITINEARQAVKQSFWGYVVDQSSKSYNVKYAARSNSPKKINSNLLQGFKLGLGQNFSWLKNFYRRAIRPLTGAPLQLHYEVLRPESKYYKDFKPVMDSFTGNSTQRD